MTCFTPNQGYQKVLKSGKIGFTYSSKFARKVNGMPVPMQTICHKCEGCRNDYARGMATRIVHEAQMHKGCNSFVTLTYNDFHIPPFGTLVYSHVSDFMKRLRDAVYPNLIRYYGVGEYGDKNLRPHYHIIIFGWDFPDKYAWDIRNGIELFRSPLLEKLWTVPKNQGYEFEGQSLGYSSVGDVTHGSASYVARYSMKKIIGKDPNMHMREIDDRTGEVIIPRYMRFHPETGEKVFVEKERAFMSNGGGKSGKGGIGKSWFDEYALNDLYPKDYTHNEDGYVVRPTKYYDKLLDRVFPEMLEYIKLARQDHLSKHASEFTPERLADRRLCFLEKMKKYKRELGRIYSDT